MSMPTTKYQLLLKSLRSCAVICVFEFYSIARTLIKSIQIRRNLVQLNIILSILAHCAPKKKSKKRRSMEEKIQESYSLTKFLLNNGTLMPKIGLGTYKIQDSSSIEEAVDAALDAGYRLFDTAAVYNNEVSLGEAFRKLIPKYNLMRDELFITTKLPPGELGSYQVVSAAYQRSLDNLGIGHADLYLIHFPGSAKISSHDKRNPTLRRSTWEALTRLYDEGRVNAIGVANFTVKHLKDLDIQANGVIPAVNQVEWHPHYYQEELMAYCRQKDICLQAYGSFGGASSGDKTLLNDPVVKRIADDHASGPAQVLLAWALQQDIGVIPKSVQPQRIHDNFIINFLLTEPEMKALNALCKNGKKYAWDPSDVR